MRNCSLNADLEKLSLVRVCLPLRERVREELSKHPGAEPQVFALQGCWEKLSVCRGWVVEERRAGVGSYCQWGV